MVETSVEIAVRSLTIEFGLTLSVMMRLRGSAQISPPLRTSPEAGKVQYETVRDKGEHCAGGRQFSQACPESDDVASLESAGESGLTGEVKSWSGLENEEVARRSREDGL